ncbi:hypothetical protein AGOR_G00110900 [Albula goreensis]|uniref:Rhodanese domain-containing protein n=1 Tax=Albula goreensis TaxID=1534307 RepID=A0A8T3DEA4_9TELE|nr:hypothetical protein AGOR_G00110900 [Albula goreensis]
MEPEILRLKEQLLERENEISALKDKLAQLQTLNQSNNLSIGLQDKVTALAPLKAKASLSNEEIMRYSRQLLLPELGVQGLGCPLAQYLAAAGIGRLGLLDYDEVELNNLHRQVLHREDTRGQPKALSAAQAIKRLNSAVECVPYHLKLSHENALQLVQQYPPCKNKKVLYKRRLALHVSLTPFLHTYDIVADCSDNVPTRYLVNDACVLSGKPLVSASALRMEGQLTVYNYQGGPCYRCLYPVPPPPETVTNCSDGGVLGVVPGIMGCLQALEVLKIASGQQCIFYSQAFMLFHPTSLRLVTQASPIYFCTNKCLLFKTAGMTASFLRPAAADGGRPGGSVPLDPAAAAAGGVRCVRESPTVTALQDYEQFCGSAATDKCRRLCLLSKEERVSVKEYKEIVDEGTPHLLLDVRPLVEVDICHLPFSLPIPLASLEDRKTEHIQLLKERIAETKQKLNSESCVPVYVICKMGNDSQKAVQVLQRMSGSEVEPVSAKDISGGLMAWAQKIDPSFPQY